MKRTPIVLALVAIVLTGCVTPKAVDIDPDVACHDRTTVLNHARYTSISHTHPYVDMCQGFTLRIMVVPPVGMNVARSTADDQQQAYWLSKQVGNRGIEITVPNLPTDDIDVGDEFEYTLTVDGVGSLDPMIRIIQ